MASTGYRVSGGNYYDSSGGYVGGATYKFDELGRIVGGIGPNGEQLDQNGKIVGFDYSGAAGSPYAANAARGFVPGGNTAVSASIAGAGSAGGSAGASSGDAKLEAARKQAFASLGQGSNYFAGGLGQQASNAIANTMSGVDVPYTQGVQDRLFGQASDLNAGARASADDTIRRSLAERGMEGSGGGIAAMLSAGRDQSASNSQALSQIQNTAQLENFSARERARSQAESFLSSRSQAEAPYRLKEADLLSRMEVTGESPFASALAGLFGGGQPRSATGSPNAGSQLGLGTGGAFNIPGRSTIGPGSGSNMGVSVGNTPTQVPQAGGYAQQAKQATQARPSTAYVPSTAASRGAAMSGPGGQYPYGAAGQLGAVTYDPWAVNSSKGW